MACLRHRIEVCRELEAPLWVDLHITFPRLTNIDDLLDVAARLYGSVEKPKPFVLIEVAKRISFGEEPKTVAREIRSTRQKILEVFGAGDPVRQVFKSGLADAADPDKIARVRRGIGQMLLGTLVEQCFEKGYRTIVQTDELRLEED